MEKGDTLQLIELYNEIAEFIREAVTSGDTAYIVAALCAAQALILKLVVSMYVTTAPEAAQGLK